MAAAPDLGNQRGRAAADFVVRQCIQICEFGYYLTGCVLEGDSCVLRTRFILGMLRARAGRDGGIPGLKGETWGTRQLSSYSACLVMLSNTPTHANVTNSDDPP